MIADLFEVKQTKNKGKGLFAKEFIPKGTIVCFECSECKQINASEIGYDSMSEKEKFDLLDYAYRKKDGTFIAPCGNVRYLNHSCNANILGTEQGFDIVVRDIDQGQEATYDYRDFYEDVKMTCNCQQENCCKIVDFKHPILYDLKKFWNEKTEDALKYVNKVDQPLKEQLKESSVFFTY